MNEPERIADSEATVRAEIVRAEETASARTLDWAKLLFPLAVIVVYSAGQYFSGAGAYRGAKSANEAESLTGIDPKRAEEKLSREGRALIAELETLAARDEWESVRRRVGEAPEALRAHSAVKGFVLLARTKVGERGAMLEREMIALAPALSRDGEYAALREQLDMAQARLIVDRSDTLELLMANAESLRRLVDGAPLRPSVVDTRIRIARRYEQIGVERYEAALSRTPDDPIGMREARGLFQGALRWIVAQEGWATLTPLSESFRPHTERIVGRIQQTNRLINPTDLPFTDRDAGTWTGKKGDPIHDAPRP